jgi:hypothetical protein
MFMLSFGAIRRNVRSSFSRSKSKPRKQLAAFPHVAHIQQRCGDESDEERVAVD